jgi:hypothetical protein
MVSLVDLARHYDENGLYRRERRPFRRRLLSFWKRSPEVESLRPETRHELFGPRTGFLDRVQGVFGYFFGGGWVYGLVENTGFRASTAGYTAYQSTSLSDPLSPLGFRVGGALVGDPDGAFNVPADPRPQVPANGYLHAAVSRDALNKPANYPDLNPEPLPTFAYLRPIDQFAHLHDIQLRKRDERVWAGDLSEGSDEHKQLSRAANGALLSALEGEDWDVYRDEWRAAKPALDRKLWEEMGSLLAYERCVAKFAIFFLGLPGWSDTEMAPLLVPPVEHMTLAGMRPVDARFEQVAKKERKAARALVKQCCSEAHSIRREAEQQYQL